MADGNPQGANYAGLGSRILAYIVDSLLLGVVALVFAFVLFQVAPATNRVVIQLIFFAVTLAYFIYFEGSSGQTPGKSAVNIAVVTENNEPMTYGTATVRNVLRIVDGLFLYLVGIAVIALSDDNQRIGDMIASTVVVKTE